MTSHTGESSPGENVGPGTHSHEDSNAAQQLRIDYDASQVDLKLSRRPQFFRVPRWPAIGFMLLVVGALLYFGGQAAGARQQSVLNSEEIEQAEIAAEEAKEQVAGNREILTAGVRCILRQLDETPDARLSFEDANGDCARFLEESAP